MLQHFAGRQIWNLPTSKRLRHAHPFGGSLQRIDLEHLRGWQGHPGTGQLGPVSLRHESKSVVSLPQRWILKLPHFGKRLLESKGSRAKKNFTKGIKVQAGWWVMPQARSMVWHDLTTVLSSFIEQQTVLKIGWYNIQSITSLSLCAKVHTVADLAGSYILQKCQ